MRILIQHGTLQAKRTSCKTRHTMIHNVGCCNGVTCQSIRANYQSIAYVLAFLEKNKLFNSQRLITVTSFSLNRELQLSTVFESKLTTFQSNRLARYPTDQSCRFLLVPVQQVITCACSLTHRVVSWVKVPVKSVNVTLARKTTVFQHFNCTLSR